MCPVRGFHTCWRVAGGGEGEGLGHIDGFRFHAHFRPNLDVEVKERVGGREGESVRGEHQQGCACSLAERAQGRTPAPTELVREGVASITSNPSPQCNLDLCVPFIHRESRHVVRLSSSKRSSQQRYCS